MGVKFVDTDKMSECPCGNITPQVIFWDYQGNSFVHTQTICNMCKEELFSQLSKEEQKRA